jgi:protein involved in polysaccharide export with SLBB domain
MRKISRSFLAVTLALTSIATTAQEAVNRTDRSDMFGQSPSSTQETFTPRQEARSSRTSIRNTESDTFDSDTTARDFDTSVKAPDSETRERTFDSDRAARASSSNRDFSRQHEQQGNVRGSLARRAPTSEFQKFLFDSTGKNLPIFGTEFFTNAPSTFAPILNAPVPSEYPLGPGDELLIRGWGSIDIDYRAKIDRNGMISIPTVGSIVLGGVKAGDAEGVIRGAVAKLYKGVTVNVNFGHLRAITVYVVGQASRPGTYTVSSLSSLVTALFASGGPNANGSMRRVQVKRAGKVVAELDLYAFIAKGDKSADIKLQDGDSIYIPSATGYMALVGKVNSPAIYELRSESDTIESLLEVAGGLPVVADPRRAFLERIDPKKSQPRSVEQFALNTDGVKRVLKNGDVLNITSITPDFSNAVVLRGNVDQAMRAPFQPGMRVSDLIPNREYLITRKSIQRQNNAVNAIDDDKSSHENRDRRSRENSDRYSRENSETPVRENGNRQSRENSDIRFRENSEVRSRENNDRRARDNGDTIASRIGGLIDEINWDYAVVERINKSDLSVSLIPFNLGNVFANPAGVDNIQLQPGDTVTIFSQKDVLVPMDKRRVFVRVEGEVNVPGVYQMTSGETLHTLIARAGGPTNNAYLFGTAFYREQVRKEQELNLEKAATRLEAHLQTEQSKAAANVRANSPGDAQIAESRRQADLLAAKETVARFRELKPTGRIAFGLEPKERSFNRLPQLKLENGDRLVVPARPEFVHVFGSVNAEASPLWRSNSRVADYLKMAGVTADADTDNIFILRVDGSVISHDSGKWYFGGIGGMEVMPGDSIVVPEKFDKETRWTKLTNGTREWAQIFANFGLGAAAIKTLSN